MRICDFILGTVWVLHHSIFLLFLYFEEKVLNENDFLLIAYSGISAILTVIAIILLQTIKLLIKILLFIEFCLKFLVTNIKKMNQNKKDKKDKEF